MGLDVYVGSLLPYFGGDWETESAQLYIQDGATQKAVVIKSNRRLWNSAGINSVPEALEAIRSWRNSLSEGLSLPEPLEWREDDEGDYYTLQLGWPGYEGLLLWAAYEGSGEAPPAYLPDSAHRDPVLQGSRASITDSRYRSLLDKTEIWLPGNYALTFRAPDPTGKRIDFGFTGALLDELVDLNARTWQADLDTIIRWSDSPVAQGTPLEACAQFGFAVLYRLAVTARKHELPMVLDY